MVVAATGSQGKALENLQSLVAASSSFQGLVGAADAAAAKAHIYLTAAASPIAAKRPFAMVRQVLENGFGYEAVGLGSSHDYREFGRLELLFAIDTPAGRAANEGNAEAAFLNIIEPVLEDMDVLAGAGYLAVRGLTVDIGPVHSHEAEDASEGDYWLARCLVDWGLEV